MAFSFPYFKFLSLSAFEQDRYQFLCVFLWVCEYIYICMCLLGVCDIFGNYLHGNSGMRVR